MADEDRLSEPPQRSADMDPEEFRRQGHRVVELVADYLRDLESYRVLPDVEPGAVRSRLPAEPPRGPEPFDRVLEDYRSLIVPNTTQWQHPGFMAYLPSVASGPGILGEWLSASLNSNVMMWRNAPAATELEERVVGWLRQMMGLPEVFDGMFTDTASVSGMLALVAARHAVLGASSRTDGLLAEPVRQLRVYASQEAHSWLDKAAITTGVGLRGVCRVPPDENFAMRTELLERSIEQDRKAGHKPFCVVGTLGTTSTCGMDPAGKIAAVCRKHGLWFLIDAAYAGVGAMLPEKRPLFEGWEQADAIVVNAHKWLFTPFDASLLLFRDAELFRAAFSVVPEYLKTRVSGEVHNYSEYGIQLGRRFRALKIWTLIRHFGVDGIAERLREHCRMASEMAGWIDSDPDWERLAPVQFGVLCFRFRPPHAGDGEALDRLNEQVMDAVNADGRIFLSHTRVDGRYALRAVFGNPRQTMVHVRRCWRLLCEAGVAST